MKLALQLLLAAFFFFPAALHAATTINVPGDSLTIQGAIDAAANGDTVVVAPGIYHEKINFHGKAITVTSQSGPSVTAIDGDNTGTVVTFQTAETSLSVLNGFTIQHGSASFGAGITLGGSAPTISGNVFDSNAQGGGGFGAGIGGNNSSPVIKQNKFQNNTCDAQFLSGVVAFVNSSSPKIIDNLFTNNPCRAINMTLPTGNSPEITNNTITGNAVGIRVDARVNTASQLYRNNIIVGNGIGLFVEFGSVANNPTWKNNLVFNNTTDYSGISDQTGLNGNISADPKFIDAVGGDYHLDLGSPAIDTGNSAAPSLPTVDLDGINRILDGDGDSLAVVDIGAYEFGPNPGILEFSSANFAATENSGSAGVLVLRKRGKTGAVTVDFATTDGTALAGTDYVSTALTLSFADNDIGPKMIDVPLLDNPILEGGETINLTIDNPTGGAVLGPVKSAVLTITDSEDLSGSWIGPGTSTIRKPFTIKIALDAAGNVLRGKLANMAITSGQIQFNSSTRDITGDVLVLKHGLVDCTVENGSEVNGQGALTGTLFCSTGEEISFLLTKQTINLTAPNGGEIWPAGSVQMIRWTSDIGGKLRVEVSRDGGLSWSFLFLKGSSGSAKWPVGGPTTTNARIRICTVLPPVTCDVSEGNFTIQ